MQYMLAERRAYRFRRLVMYSLALLTVAVLLSGCGNSAVPQPEASGQGLTGPDDVLKLYRNNCISCHGTDLQGMMGEDSNLQHVGAAMNRDQIRVHIEKGGSLMPAFGSKLDAQQIDSLADWLASRK